MPVSFKPPITVQVYSRTPADQLVFCEECGGLNALGRVAVKIDCAACDTTGYENFFTIREIPGYYIPGGIKRWDIQRGGIVYEGQSGLKVSADYEDLLADATHLAFNGIQWHFNSISDPGQPLGQRRLLLSLVRKE